MISKSTKLICLVSLLFGLSACSINPLKNNYFHPNSPKSFSYDIAPTPAQFKGTIKVVSFNIKYGKKIDQAITLFENNLDLKDADIVLLQEMDDEGVQKFAQALKYNYIYFPSAFHPIPRKDLGNAILSKWPIKNEQKIILKPTDNTKLQRIAVNTIISIKNKEVSVFSVHMDVILKPIFRKSQITRVIKYVPQDIQYCIIGGDFNTLTEVSRRWLFNPFLEKNFQIATKDVGWTFNYWYLLNKKSSLDHIFTKGFKVIQAGKVSDRTASDHLPIWAILSFKE